MVKGKSKKELPEEILNEDGIVDATLSLDDFEPDFDDLAVEDEEDITEEPMSVFAEGLPSWDIVPPQLLVRRKRQK